MLVLHIGLPKTATTFLQYQVFPRQSRYTYIHNAKSGPIEQSLIRIVKSSEDEVAEHRRDLLDQLPESDVLVSNERISINGKEAWTSRSKPPEHLSSRLSLLKADVEQVRIIVTIRRQARWLASRYAESAKAFREFSQSDFERRIDGLCEEGPEHGLRWLDYHSAWSSLVKGFGRGNVLFIPAEAIECDFVHVLETLEAFLGCSGFLKSYEAQEIDIRRKNALSSGDNLWRMRERDDEILHLHSGLEERVAGVFGQSNRSLAEETSLDLEKCGYY